MIHAYLEIFKAMIFLVLMLYLLRLASLRKLRGERGWRFIFAGCGFMFIAFFVSATEEIPWFSQFLIVGGTVYEKIFKNGLLFPLGFISISIGMAQLIPFVDLLKEAELKLAKTLAETETRVAERTSDLRIMNEQMKYEIEERKAAENALYHHIHFLETLLEAIPNPVFYKDINGKYLGCNRAFEKWIRHDKQQIIGKDAFDLLPQYYAEKYHSRDMDLFPKSGHENV